MNNRKFIILILSTAIVIIVSLLASLNALSILMLLLVNVAIFYLIQNKKSDSEE